MLEEFLPYFFQSDRNRSIAPSISEIAEAKTWIKMNEQYIFRALLSCLVVLAACTSKHTPIDYVGQYSPGTSAKTFAPGIITTAANEHSALVFSPDGACVLWAVMDKNYKGRIFEMTFHNGAWTKPATPAFADTATDHYAPSFSPDGKTLFFSSRRKAPAGFREGRGNRIWKVSRTGTTWGTPTPIDTIVSKAEEFSHSVSKRGTLYFSSALGGKDMNLHYSVWDNNSYSKPVTLPATINTPGYEDGPYIAPDESYLIFESTRPEGIEGSHDLYISFKAKDGTWQNPMNMGPSVNSNAMERFPSVSPDGKFLFFASDREKSNGKVGFDFYWIDASVIDDLRAHP